jgi:hypothetical protein
MYFNPQCGSMASAQGRADARARQRQQRQTWRGLAATVCVHCAAGAGANGEAGPKGERQGRRE